MGWLAEPRCRWGRPDVAEGTWAGRVKAGGCRWGGSRSRGAVGDGRTWPSGRGRAASRRAVVDEWFLVLTFLVEDGRGRQVADGDDVVGWAGLLRSGNDQ